MVQNNSIGRRKILVVDDNVFIREIFQVFFEQLDILISTCALPSEAEKLAENEIYDLVIADANIPGTGGAVEVLERLRRLRPEIRIIFMSGDLNSPLMDNPEKYGFVGAFPKPIEFSKLEKIINS